LEDFFGQKNESKYWNLLLHYGASTYYCLYEREEGKKGKQYPSGQSTYLTSLYHWCTSCTRRVVVCTGMGMGGNLVGWEGIQKLKGNE
jgi:hypothetical protein